MKIYIAEKTIMFEYDYPVITLGHFKDKSDAEKAIEEDRKQFLKGYYDYYIMEDELK